MTRMLWAEGRCRKAVSALRVAVGLDAGVGCAGTSLGAGLGAATTAVSAGGVPGGLQAAKTIPSRATDSDFMGFPKRQSPTGSPPWETVLEIEVPWLLGLRHKLGGRFVQGVQDGDDIRFGSSIHDSEVGVLDLAAHRAVGRQIGFGLGARKQRLRPSPDRIVGRAGPPAGRRLGRGGAGAAG